MNRKERNKYQRDRRKRTGNSDTKKYEKTKKGFLMRCYRNMKSRVTGIQYLKSHLYKGKYLLDKNVFYKWSLENIDFHSLFDVWELSDYDRKITPSIDRIDVSLGYELNNIRWITHSENSRLGSLGEARQSQY